MDSDTTDLPSVDELTADPEARLDYLVAVDVLEIDDEDAVTTTESFEDTRSIYADTYKEGQLPEDQFVQTVADLFDLSTDEARSQIEAEDVSRHEVITYLSLQSYIDQELPRETLALLAAMAAEVGVGSPVPDSMDELTDESYAEYIADAGDIVVFVWKYPCDPCRRLKAELPAVLDRLPESISIAGVDGDRVTEFRETYDVDSAPVVLVFADGELQARRDGYAPPELLLSTIVEGYDDLSIELADED